MAGLDETRRQYDTTRADFEPYRELGIGGAQGLGDLVGINGGDAQSAEIEALRASPLYQSLYDNGEEALLQTASATGGLRGGNTQRGLADFGRDTLSQVIEQQLSRYAGLAGIGQGAAGSVGAFGADAVASMNASRNAGAGAKAGGILTRAGINARNWQNAGGFLDDIGNKLASAFMPGIGGF